MTEVPLGGRPGRGCATIICHPIWPMTLSVKTRITSRSVRTTRIKVWCQHHNGIFVSSDGAETFEEIHDVKPSVFGFGVAVHPDDPDTAWFAPAQKDEYRVPVDGKMVVTRTRDGGKTFESLDRGLPQGASYDLIYRHALTVDDSGNHLAMGSTTGNLWVSANGGDDWQQVSGHLPPIAQADFVELPDFRAVRIDIWQLRGFAKRRWLPILAGNAKFSALNGGCHRVFRRDV